MIDEKHNIDNIDQRDNTTEWGGRPPMKDWQIAIRTKGEEGRGENIYLLGPPDENGMRPVQDKKGKQPEGRKGRIAGVGGATGTLEVGVKPSDNFIADLKTGGKKIVVDIGGGMAFPTSEVTGFVYKDEKGKIHEIKINSHGTDED